jgi:hypothetical protein
LPQLGLGTFGREQIIGYPRLIACFAAIPSYKCKLFMTAMVPLHECQMDMFERGQISLDAIKHEAFAHFHLPGMQITWGPHCARVPLKSVEWFEVLRRQRRGALKLSSMDQYRKFAHWKSVS